MIAKWKEKVELTLGYIHNHGYTMQKHSSIQNVQSFNPIQSQAHQL
jgi:hypothetical protein